MRFTKKKIEEIKKKYKDVFDALEEYNNSRIFKGRELM